MLSFSERLGLAWRILRARPSGLVDYAEREFDITNGFPAGHPMEQRPIGATRFDGFQRHIRDLLLVFSTYGHSGGSAPFGIATFCRLAKFKPLSPLTGDESEWMEVEHGTVPTWQNRRCSSVFRSQKIDEDVPIGSMNGSRISHEFYDIDAAVFLDPEGITWSNPSSMRDVEMPYEVPDQPQVIKVDADGAPIPQPISIAPDLVETIENLLPNHDDGPVIRGALAAARAQR